MPRPLPEDEALKKARVEGKYAMLLRQFKAEKDYEQHGAFKDLGVRQMTEYAGQANLPKGNWVYVYPYWYIWRDQTAMMKPKRAWGPEQATGPPDVPQAGDSQNAWCSLGADDREEWLLCEYAEPVLPNAVMIYENLAPGAVNKVSVFKLDGTEVEAWKGKDPTSTDSESGVSVIPIKVNFKVNRIKVYIDSPNVEYWQEIDAVGLRDTTNKTHWATTVEASSTYAQDMPAFVPFVPATDPALMQKLTTLESEVKSLKQQLQEQDKKRTDEVRELKAMVKELKDALKK